MALTYRELIENLKSLPDERLDDNVTVFASGLGEFYALVDDFPFVVTDSEIQNEFTPGAGEGVLDDGHAYLVI
jgi:hypothetical protein